MLQGTFRFAAGGRFPLGWCEPLRLRLQGLTYLPFPQESATLRFTSLFDAEGRVLIHLYLVREFSY